ncbi:MAG: pyridoxamine 5'-phosphate oxidase family protein [Candidatus Saccharimonadales bacterium]
MTKQSEHAKRIADELHEAGASSYGASKFASRYLPNVIHPDERVMAAVYGRYDEGGGLLRLSAGMLVATDKRVIFLDHKPGFTSMDEISYDVVSGVKQVTSALASTLTLHTRVGDYVIRYANHSGIDRFVGYIEARRVEVNGVSEQVPRLTQVIPDGSVDKAAIKFLREHELAVLSTVDRTGNLHGAAIYYFIDDDDRVCMATKAGTHKAGNMFGHQQVALTAYDAGKMQTAQLQGIAEVVTSPTDQQTIFAKIIKPRDYNGEQRLPPITTIHEEGFVALRIIPTTARYTDFKTLS